MSFPHWDMYKAEVAQRSDFYYELGMAVIRVVEDCCMEDWAEAICVGEYADGDEEDWDFNVEDVMGQSDQFSHAVFCVFWNE